MSSGSQSERKAGGGGSSIARPLRFEQTQASVLLDLVRGLAALMVLGEHWRNLLFVDFPQLVAHRWMLAVPYLLTGAGHQAVVIFFVLSGYLIGGSVFRALGRGRWSWASYMTHRLVRLWIVLVPGLLLCVLWDNVGMVLGRAPLVYAGGGSNHMIGAVRTLLTPGIFAGNLFFLQTIRVPVLGSDSALWSLANEFWYYVLFPLGCMVMWRRSSMLSRVLCGVGFAAVAWFTDWSILTGFPIWLAGVLLTVVPPPRVGAGFRWGATALYVPLVFGLAKYRGMGGLQADYVLAVATFVVLWVLLSARDGADADAKKVRAARGLSRFSFTLYVAHTPFLLLLTSLVAGDSRWVPTAAHTAIGLLMLIAALVYAYGVAWVTEFRTGVVRGWVERGLGFEERASG